VLRTGFQWIRIRNSKLFFKGKQQTLLINPDVQT